MVSSTFFSAENFCSILIHWKTCKDLFCQGNILFHWSSVQDIYHSSNQHQKAKYGQNSSEEGKELFNKLEKDNYDKNKCKIVIGGRKVLHENNISCSKNWLAGLSCWRGQFWKNVKAHIFMDWRDIFVEKNIVSCCYIHLRAGRGNTDTPFVTPPINGPCSNILKTFQWWTVKRLPWNRVSGTTTA